MPLAELEAEADHRADLTLETEPMAMLEDQAAPADLAW
jgi:hypothetical protein